MTTLYGFHRVATVILIMAFSSVNAVTTTSKILEQQEWCSNNGGQWTQSDQPVCSIPLSSTTSQAEVDAKIAQAQALGGSLPTSQKSLTYTQNIKVRF